MRTEMFADGFKETPYWWEAADPAAASPADLPPVPEKIDVAVIGGGYAGLSCALELARRGIPCAVFDGEPIGWGASSRNGGMVSGGINVGKGVDLTATYGAERARAMGLVWKVVPHDDLMAEARHLAERLCQAAPLAVRATKEVAVRCRTLPWVEAVRFGETMRLVIGGTADAAEGRAAARDKRAPHWQGK